MNAPAKAQFRAMTEGTAEDWSIIAEQAKKYWAGLGGRVLTHLRLLDGDFGGFPVDRLEHSLQTATLAAEAGRDEEYVVCALLHDMGDTLGSLNHADLAATILQPFVSEQNHWMVKHHGIFQGYYFFHHLGKDRNMRDQFKDNEHFNYCAEFCHKYDQKACDPEFTSMPLAEFEPMVERLFAEPKRALYL
ncbi:MAG: HD domain-containing protein [Gammaproteobacteria bacterium]|nr:HD domain-containing protein [Gammaproteobacteria bacterium]